MTSNFLVGELESPSSGAYAGGLTPSAAFSSCRRQGERFARHRYGCTPRGAWWCNILTTDGVDFTEHRHLASFKPRALVALSPAPRFWRMPPGHVLLFRQASYGLSQPCKLQPVDKTAISGAVCASGSVDPYIPQFTHVTLLLFTMRVRVGKGVNQRFVGATIQGVPDALMSFCRL